MIKFIAKWLIFARFHTIPIAISPIIIGLSCCQKVNITAACITIISAIFIQMGTNLVNDLCDFKSGADKKKRLGPKRALVEGKTSQKSMFFAIIFCFTIAAICGLYLVYLGGILIAIIGISAIFFGIIYTAGPLPAYLGYSELLTICYFGPIATIGTAVVQQQQPSNHLLKLGIICGLFSAIILTINNLRDLKSDLAANKRTLIVKLGRKFGLFLLYLEFTIIIMLMLNIKAPIIALISSIPTLLAIFLCTFFQPSASYNHCLKVVIFNELLIAVLFVYVL